MTTAADDVLAWAADRCEVVAHRYLRRDAAVSDAADLCKDAVRAIPQAACRDAAHAQRLAVQACQAVTMIGRTATAVQECVAAIAGWPACASWQAAQARPRAAQ